MEYHANAPHADQRISPPEAVYHEVQDEMAIRAAITEVDELMSSLRHLDRHDPANSHFIGWRSGEDKCFSAYRALRHIREDLIEMLEEE